MTKKSLVKNYIFNLSYQIVSIIIPLITTPYLSRVLGSEKIGIYGYTLSITTYFIVFGALGIAMYGQREIAYVQNDKEKRTQIFWELITIKLISAILSFSIFFTNFGFSNEYSVYYRIFSLLIFSNTIDIAWFYYGMEEFNGVAIKNTIVKIIEIISIFLFVKTKDDLGIYVTIYVLGMFFGNLSLFMNLSKYIYKPNIRKINIRRHIKSIFALFIPQVAMQVYTIIDKTMLGNLSTMSEVGFYEQSQKIVKLVLTLATAFSGVMTSRMAYLFSKKSNTKIEDTLKIAFNFIWFLSFPVMIGLIVISEKFVPIFYGYGYDTVKVLLIVFSPMMLASGISNIIGMLYLVPSKKQNLLTISVIIGVFINLILNFLLIGTMKSIGCAIASVIAEFCICIIQIQFVKKDINICKMFKGIGNYIFSSVVMGLIVFAIISCFKTTIFTISIGIISGAVIYFMLLYLMKDNFFLKILVETKNYISKIWKGKC